jgi:hypothetical protein
MTALAAALVCALAAGACSEHGRTMIPTSATPSPGVTGPGGSVGTLRVEQWSLEVRIRTVLGAGDCDASGEPVRAVPLGIAHRADGTVAVYYDRDDWPAGHVADWTGWVVEHGFEGTGTAYEGLPCSGTELEPAGAPSTLTGYFSGDGRMFTAVEVRRYLGRDAGEIVYHLEWTAERVGE